MARTGVRDRWQATSVGGTSSNQPTGRSVAHDKHVQRGTTWARRWAEAPRMWWSSTLGNVSQPSRTDVCVLRVVEKAACGGRHALLVHGQGTSTRTEASLSKKTCSLNVHVYRLVQVPMPKASEELSPQLQARD
ncbi:hypothetical protein BCR44DRAFT_1441892 [Catenaria anguillulae PL171]|uniref:Uncharacterized protein n=1 Tax=Catenaria anguillulae PL171 TaxID=765915 RepID=A0A1Y2HCI0_9FUNG|nr:hypothetical protein BCR44DRAFT_1441892 [Catenaria anguillulae PL171]